MTNEEIKEKYTARYSKLCLCSNLLIEDVKIVLDGVKRIDQISGRAKGIDSFLQKATKTVEENGERKRKYTNPFVEIQDQIGIRVVATFQEDVEIITKKIIDYYSIVEEQSKHPEDDYTFRYFGKHFILIIPDKYRNQFGKEYIPTVFELQIKTLFQHAWGQCDHDLNYKGNLDADSKRLIGFASAQAWGADEAFNNILNKLSQNA